MRENPAAPLLLFTGVGGRVFRLMLPRNNCVWSGNSRKQRGLLVEVLGVDPRAVMRSQVSTESKRVYRTPSVSLAA